MAKKGERNFCVRPIVLGYTRKCVSVHRPSWKRFIKLTQMSSIAAFLQFVTARRMVREMDGGMQGMVSDFIKYEI